MVLPVTKGKIHYICIYAAMDITLLNNCKVAYSLYNFQSFSSFEVNL